APVEAGVIDGFLVGAGSLEPFVSSFVSRPMRLYSCGFASGSGLSVGAASAAAVEPLPLSALPAGFLPIRRNPSEDPFDAEGDAFDGGKSVSLMTAKPEPLGGGDGAGTLVTTVGGGGAWITYLGWLGICGTGCK